MAMEPDEKRLRRVRDLIRQASSPHPEEARTAAWQACRILREMGLDATPEAILGRAALPGPVGAAAPRPERPAPHAALPEPMYVSDDIHEQMRVLQRMLDMRTAQVFHATRQLSQSERRARQLEQENEEIQRRLTAEKARVRALRGYAAVPPSTAPRGLLPVGAGKRELW